jgi:hypothetical protein
MTRKKDETVGRYVAAAGYAFGKPRPKPCGDALMKRCVRP